jgi:HTH-like domain
MSRVSKPDIRLKTRVIVTQRRRFGYRRIGLMLEREGITMNRKTLQRIYPDVGCVKLAIFASVSIRSASVAGLSLRMREIRGNRMARPDLCRLLV